MGLTVTEKEHWKDRIARRIDKKIEALGAEDPHLFERVQQQARQRALESLGLADMQTELDTLQREREALEKRAHQIIRTMLAQVRGVPVDEVNDVYTYRRDHEVDAAVARRQSVHEDQLLAESERGRQILRLRREKDELIDVVWLATSPSQVRDLWSKVAELLGDVPTQLERGAMAITPACDD